MRFCISSVRSFVQRGRSIPFREWSWLDSCYWTRYRNFTVKKKKIENESIGANETKQKRKKEGGSTKREKGEARNEIGKEWVKTVPILRVQRQSMSKHTWRFLRYLRQILHVSNRTRLPVNEKSFPQIQTIVNKTKLLVERLTQQYCM